MLNDLRQDLRYALRGVVGNPGFAAVAVLSLALGIGANTAVFSLIDGVMLRPLPVSDPEELVLLTMGENFLRLVQALKPLTAPWFSAASYRPSSDERSLNSP